MSRNDTIGAVARLAGISVRTLHHYDEIGRVLDDPAYDRLEALRQQRTRLERSRKRMTRLIAAVDAAISAAEEGRTMTPEESLEVFGDFDPSQYEAEVKQRWGDTDPYKESAQRTKGYTKHDWQQIGADSNDINQVFIALMNRGIPASSPEAQAVAERHRGHISKWFYECSPEIHQGLGRMYVADRRFTENIDRAHAGLAQYMSEAIEALWG